MSQHILHCPFKSWSLQTTTEAAWLILLVQYDCCISTWWWLPPTFPRMVRIDYHPPPGHADQNQKKNTIFRSAPANSLRQNHQYILSSHLPRRAEESTRRRKMADAIKRVEWKIPIMIMITKSAREYDDVLGVSIKCTLLLMRRCMSDDIFVVMQQQQQQQVRVVDDVVKLKTRTFEWGVVTV